MTTAPPVAEAHEDPRLEAAVQFCLASPAWARPPRSAWEAWASVGRELVGLLQWPPESYTYGMVREALEAIAVTCALEVLRDPASADELTILETETDHLERRRALLEEAVGDPYEFAPGRAIAGVDEAIGLIMVGLPVTLLVGHRCPDVRERIASVCIRALAEIPGMAPGLPGSPLGNQHVTRF